MKTFKTFVAEMKKPRWEVPAEPGSTPIPKDHVRLFHQTNGRNISSIRRHGLEARQPVEGPRGIYADEKGFYGKPDQTPSIEFHVKKSEFSRPFVHRDKVEPDQIVAAHKPWHASVRYIDADPQIRKDVEAGKHDDLMKFRDDPTSKAVRFVKKRAKANNT
jgi:hypothetical protein